MCGICGLLGRRDADHAAVERMNAAMVHRGPDHGAVQTSGRCTLGYRRLSVIDLQTGEQPIANERGDVVAVFNGEIYNFKELRAELESRGHDIRGSGDSPLIPHAYEEWGDDFADRLHGMFAIALWDATRERLVLARDAVGKKPLLYAALANGDVAFASETKALLRLPALSRDLDVTQLDAYLALQYTPRSALQAVQHVPPGGLVTFEDTRVEVRRYWQPTALDVGDAWRGVVRDEINAAVRRRLVADVPLGALVSGGIDSAIVVAAMAEASTTPVRTFTVGFADPAYDERAHARVVAQHFGTDHTELEVEVTPDQLERLADVLDEPFGDEAALPQLLISEVTRRHVTVALTGDGGDEVFGGYERYRAHGLAARVPAPLARAALLAPFGRRNPRSPAFRARRLLGVAAAPGAERYARLVEVFPLGLRRRLWLDPNRARPAQTYLPNDDDLRVVDFESYLPGDILRKADLTSMAASLELRAPLLDRRVVEVGLGLPSDVAFGKRALRAAFAPVLPPSVLERRKTGFGVPLDRWFRTQLRDTAKELLLGQDRGLFDRRVLASMLDEHVRGAVDRGHQLWCLCMLELWQRRFVDA